MRNQPIIRKYDAIEGCYGERYEVNSKNTELFDLFKLICVWTTNSKDCEDGSRDVTFELLIGDRLEDNPIIMRKIKAWGGIII